MAWVNDGFGGVMWVNCSFDPVDFACVDFTCCLPPVWICCPSCHNASTRAWRIGPAGVRGVPDSRRFFCESCGVFFTSMGETFWEAHGRLR